MQIFKGTARALCYRDRACLPAAAALIVARRDATGFEQRIILASGKLHEGLRWRFVGRDKFRRRITCGT
jgi:hypothetical protein